MTVVSAQNEMRGYHARWVPSGGGIKPAAPPMPRAGVAPSGIPQSAWNAAYKIIAKEAVVKSATGKPTPEQIMYRRVMAKAAEILRAQTSAAKKSQTAANRSAAAGRRAATQGAARQRAELHPVRGRSTTTGTRGASAGGPSAATKASQTLLQRMTAEAVKRP